MHKRTLAVLAVAAAAGAVFPFGLPKGAAAAPLVVSYDTIVISPLPIEQPGSLNPASPSTNTVTLCIQPREGAVLQPVGTTVFLQINAGLFTSPSAAGGGATVNGTPLTSTPVAFTTQATCTFQNAETTGTAADAIPVVYTGPNPVPVNGRDVIVAAGDPTDIAGPGACVASTPCNTATYVFSPVMSYTFSPAAPIAPTGSLAAGHSVTFNVTALDSTGNPVPGAYIVLIFNATPIGSATAFSAISTSQKKVTIATNRFGALNNGSVAITYTAADPLPPTGTDTIIAQNHPTATHSQPDFYTYGGPAPYTPVNPFRICDTRPAGGGIPVNQCNSGASPIGAITQGQTRAITVGVTSSGVPTTGVSAVVVNVTAINPSQGTFLSLFPGGGTKPATSNLNPAPGTVIANLVEVGVGGGKIDIFNALGTVNVAIDVEGYVSASSLGLYQPSSPVRVCDTRVGAGIATNQCSGHTIHAGTPLTFDVDAGSSVPTSGVTAVVFNLTAIAPSNQTFVKAYAAGTTAPNASNVNLNAGAIVPNRVVVPVTCSAGHCAVTIANSVGTVNVAVDIDGWFQAAGGPTDAAFSGLIPARLCDTRKANAAYAPGCSTGMVGAHGVLNLTITGVGGLPGLGLSNSPVAVVLNVTAVNATSASFVTVYPGPSSNPVPNASDLNIPSPFAVTNLVVVKVGADGSINLFNQLGSVNLIVDVLGYYSS
jgi:hypothetical protein